MSTVLVLDDTACLDPDVSGAKASRLARARFSGLPVLPGVVVPADEGREASAAAVAALSRGGSGQARLAAMGAPVNAELLNTLTERLPGLGLPVVVRSSSPFEASGGWAGAFSSFFDVGLDDLSTALRGCWSSAFSVHVLELLKQAGEEPGRMSLAILIQRQLSLESGGVARARADGSVEVNGTRGSPRDLMSGWDPGTSAVVNAVNEFEGDDARNVLGESTIRRVAWLSRAVAAQQQDDLIEWGAVNGQVFLLQAHRSDSRLPSKAPVVQPAFKDEVALRLARLAARFPGVLGESLVLPWAIGLPDLPDAPDDGSESSDAGGDLDRARILAERLTEAAWGQRGQRAAQSAGSAFAQVRGQDPGRALTRLARISPVDLSQARRLLSLLDRVGRRMVAAGLLPNGDHFWRYSLDELVARASDGIVTSLSRTRLGPDRWEPFIHTAAIAHGATAWGTPASHGISAGPVCVVSDPHHPPPFRDRSVIMAARPLPALAPLLWRAAGLVTTSGSAGAHLIEVANSLGVPAVVRANLDAVLGTALSELGDLPGLLAAVDGSAGTVAVVEA